MELYLIRHGLAGDRDPIKYPNDDDRPLTDKGREKTKAVARCLFQKQLRFDLLLTSPLVRARQTAEIVLKEGLCDRIEEFASLAPDGDLQTWVNWYSKSQYNQENSCIALVGHQPDLGNWAECLIWGSSQEKIILKKAGVVGLFLPEDSPIAKSELFLLTSPKWLV
jgi:phosphohistidine phosphatase